MLGQLGYAPPWARPADCPAGSNKCLPTDAAAYGAFARAAAARYGANSTDPTWRGTVGAWEIWNEPVGALLVIIGAMTAQGLLGRRGRRPATGEVDLPVTGSAIED
mgnify:CR=1 FL=1